MKTFFVLAASIVLVGILFCPMMMAAPSMPSDLQIVQPDPSLPKEISVFFGKWEGGGNVSHFLIVEKIDKEKASLYLYRGRGVSSEIGEGWKRYEANVSEVRGKYKLWFMDRYGKVELTLKGEYLDLTGSVGGGPRLKRVP